MDYDLHIAVERFKTESETDQNVLVHFSGGHHIHLCHNLQQSTWHPLQLLFLANGFFLLLEELSVVMQFHHTENTYLSLHLAE